jgi:hypothetical protein
MTDERRGRETRAVLSAPRAVVGEGRNGTRDEQLIRPRFLLVSPLSLPFSPLLLVLLLFFVGLPRC